MSETITLTWVQNDSDVTSHDIRVSVDGDAYASIGAHIDMDTVTTTYEAALGHTYAFKIYAYVGIYEQSEATITGAVVPELIQKFDSAGTVLSDADDWDQEAGTVSHYATGGGDGTARYVFNLLDLDDWSSGKSVDVYVKLADIAGKTESTVTKIVVDAPAENPLPAAADPVFNFPEGTITTVDKIALTSTTGVPIYYTTNGDTPTAGSTLYTEPFALTAGDPKTVKVIATGGGYSASGETTKDYTVDITSNMLAFPGAEGFGRFTSGGRSGTVYVVNTLSNGTGAGTLRGALAASGSRIVVFNIGGIIDFGGTDVEIENDNITILGETAPDPGITIIKGAIFLKASNFIMRHIRVRRGGNIGNNGDCFGTVRKGPSNYLYDVIVDHCSFSWATDECASFSGTRQATMSNNFITEPLSNTPDSSESNHNFGSLVTGRCQDISYMHNVLTHCRNRTPYINWCTRSQVVNNSVYNVELGNQFSTVDGMPDYPFDVNVVGNYYKRGSNSGTTYAPIWFLGAGNPNGDSRAIANSSCYVSGNIDTLKRPDHTYNELDAVTEWFGWPSSQDQYLSNRLDYPPITEYEASVALTNGLANSGATLPIRDAVDDGQVRAFQEGTGVWVASSENNSAYGRYPSWGSGTHSGDQVWTSNGLPQWFEDLYSVEDSGQVVHTEGWTAVECATYNITPNDL